MSHKSFYSYYIVLGPFYKEVFFHYLKRAIDLNVNVSM